MYDIDMNNLGQRLREYRKAKNITIEELGNLIGKSKATVNRYETGEILMDILTVLEICNALNIDLNDLKYIVLKKMLIKTLLMLIYYIYII